MLALDVSGSMGWPNILGMSLTPRNASAALALVTAKTERDYRFMAFTTGFVPLDITASDSIHSTLGKVSRLPFGGTDCATPMVYAEKNGLKIDQFVVYTDNETWFGDIHPAEASDA